MKIFRRIRKKLIDEEKFRQYMLYALGEIVIVILGIFIALQLNIRYENSKNEALEVKYLKGILQDVEQEIAQLDRCLIMDTAMLDAYTIIVRAFTVDSIRSNKMFLFNALRRVQYLHAFDGSRIVFEDMKSSGKINLIQSDSLRYAILNYYKYSANLIKQETEQLYPLVIEMRNEIFVTNIDYNSAEPFVFPENWVSEIDPIEFLFFESDIKSEKVRHFANRITFIKAAILANNRFRGRVIETAIALKKEITIYLESKGKKNK